MQSAKKRNPRDLHKPLFNFVGKILSRLVFCARFFWAANVRCERNIKKENVNKKARELWGESVITSMLLWLYQKLHVTFSWKLPPPANRETLFGIFQQTYNFLSHLQTLIVPTHTSRHSLSFYTKNEFFCFIFWGGERKCENKFSIVRSPWDVEAVKSLLFRDATKTKIGFPTSKAFNLDVN